MKILRRSLLLSFIGLCSFTFMQMNYAKVLANEITPPNLKYDSNIWVYKKSGQYSATSLYGGVCTNYTIYQMSDKYNADKEFNYYLVDQQSFQALDKEHNSVKKKFFGGIKFMWLNIGVSHWCNLYDKPSKQKLYDYIPKQNLEVKTYTESIGSNIGVLSSSEDGISANCSAEFSRTVSYNYDGRKVFSNSALYNDYFEISFVFDCFKVNEATFWDYAWRGYLLSVPGIFWANAINGEVTHKSNYTTFTKEMCEYSTFIIKTSIVNSYVKFTLNTTSNQLYIDYDYQNSHKFDSYTASKMITIINK